MRGRWLGFLLVAILLMGGPAGLSQTGSEASFEIRNHEDLLFTDVRQVEDLAPLGTAGYAAATQGGLVLWWGDGARTVITTLDGLPSNVVWSVDPAGDQLLVGTEFGAALVDPEAPSVQPLEPPEDIGATIDSGVVDVRVLGDGRWTIMDRDGDLAFRGPNGTWTLHETPVTDGRAQAFSTDGDHTVVGFKVKGLHKLADDGTWNDLPRPDRPPTSLAIYDDRIFLGTERGGLRVLDLDGQRQDVELPELLSPERTQPLTILTQVVHGGELWVGTPLGYQIYNAGEEAWREVSHTKLPHRWVQALLPLTSITDGAEHDQAAIGTLQGVAWPRFDVAPHHYDLHSTVNGPLTNHMRGLGVLEGELWVATQAGVAIHLPDQRTWANLGRENGIPFERLNDVEFDRHRGMAWMAAMGGAVGLDLNDRTWHVVQDQSPIDDPPNVYLDIDVDGRYLWMPEYWNGLVRYDIAENETDRFNIDDGLLSRALTCAERWNEFLVVCAQDVVQVFNLSLATPRSPLGPSYDLCAGPRCDNYPANSTLTALADGPRLWLGTVDGGVVLVERDAEEGVAVTGHWDPGDGLPAHEVRALAPAPGGVWAGTIAGLAEIDQDGGVVETWDSDQGLDSPGINGLAQIDDVLYISTLSGLYRLDLETRGFLPLHEAGGEFGPPEATLRIAYPPTGATLHHPVNMTGTLIARGPSVTSIEVSLDGGPWGAATGVSSWRYRLPVDDLSPGPHTAHVRAMAGDEVVVEHNRTFQVGDPQAQVEGPHLEHRPPRTVKAGDRLELTATLEATDPVAVEVDAVVGQRAHQVQARVVGDTATVSLEVPREAHGEVAYRFNVRSGGGEAVFPADDHYRIPIEEVGVRELRLAADQALEGPLVIEQGGSSTVRATITNEGTQPEDVRLLGSGLRPSWLSMEDSLLIPPGQRVAFDLTVEVPPNAVPTGSVLILTAQSRDGALVETLAIPVEVTGQPDIRADETAEQAPGPAGVLLVIPLAAAGLIHARRRRDL